MIATLIVIFTLVLLLISAVVVLVILMQRPSADAGMGASLGGGAAESAFGGETGTVLTKVSVRGIVAFFILTFLLFMANIYANRHAEKAAGPEVPSLGAIVEDLSAKKAETPAAPSTEASPAEAAAPAAVPEQPAK